MGTCISKHGNMHKNYNVTWVHVCAFCEWIFAWVHARIALTVEQRVTPIRSKALLKSSVNILVSEPSRAYTNSQEDYRSGETLKQLNQSK